VVTRDRPSDQIKRRQHGDCLDVQMSRALKALIVDASERDAALLLRELGRGGYDVKAERVQTRESMTAALENDHWDVVLSDYAMPRFSASAALSLVQSLGLDLPFIIVSGTAGEETAVDAMRAGAHDFMSKSGLTRLLPALERELREAANRVERKKIRDQLTISERMVSVGILTASIAHQINNPLTVMIGNLALAVEDLQKIVTTARHAGATQRSHGSSAGAIDIDWLTAYANDLGAMLRSTQEAAERVRRIARDLKAYSRSDDEVLSGAVDIRTVLDSAIRMAATEIRHRARLKRNYADVPPVGGSESRLGQVFFNLIVNAAQAIPEGHVDRNEIGVTTRLDERGQVVIEISDSGAGIAADQLVHIFDLFFTTKLAGLGTGLGLAICRGIIADLGGTIVVDSRLGVGTVFKVTLAPAGVAVAAPSPVELCIVGARRGRVLAVDDEPALCQTIEHFLGRTHDVTALTIAHDAFDLLLGGERYDVILCDLMMPQMTGMQFHGRLLQLAPDQAARLVFMTGGAFTQAARVYMECAGNRAIDKPFTVPELQQLVQDMLVD
jgi:signal transduction histidine kinase